MYVTANSSGKLLKMGDGSTLLKRDGGVRRGYRFHTASCIVRRVALTVNLRIRASLKILV